MPQRTFGLLRNIDLAFPRKTVCQVRYLRPSPEKPSIARDGISARYQCYKLA